MSGDPPWNLEEVVEDLVDAVHELHLNASVPGLERRRRIALLMRQARLTDAQAMVCAEYLLRRLAEA